ncbi:Cellulase (glycosyl hydrolase family 5) [Williamsia maris]|uniref:Cellulase (Glycosyl hydrolase family 5) n=2 Tax=Williamsia maris TaxID=72806 RepID=A0ABT1HB52_9NOCA|nr:Cellulase (glycosyl hydrolase family 5) [Williamsia maris]
MFATFGTATLIAPSAPHYAIVNAAAVDPNSDTVGISDNNLLFSATDPAVIAKHLDEMQALGIQDIRIAVPWATTEPANGQYNWTAIDNMVNAADARGMGILGVVNTTPDWARAAGTGYYTPPTNAADYGDFMGALASRYAGKMSDFEVWNEPNAFIGYSPAPDPSGYTALLKAAYPAIKAANPSATVIGGVLGSTVTWGNYTLNPVDFVQQMYADGAAGYFDALSFHPYQNTTEFSQGANLANSPLNQVTDIHQLMVANGDGTKQIWSSEYGLPTGIVGDQQQADYISDFLDNWSTLSYAGPAFLYTLQDTNSADTTDPEATFGVYTDTWTPKPAAQVISDFIAQHGTPSAMKLAAATAVADQSALPTTASPALAMDAAAQTVAETVGTAMQNYVQAISDAIASAAADAADQAAAQSDTVATDQTAATQAPTTDAARTESATTDPSATSPAATTSTTDTTAATTAPTTATAPTATATATTDAARTATSTADPTPSTSATPAAPTDPGTTETPGTTAVPTTQTPAETATAPSGETSSSAEATTPTTDSVDPATAAPTATAPATAMPAPSVNATQSATATAEAASTGNAASTGDAAARAAATG